jgi:hypothetical protein
MTGSTVANTILNLLGLFGMSGLVIFFISRKINKSDAKREKMEKARIDAEIMSSEGLCITGSLARATAMDVYSENENPDLKREIDRYDVWSAKRAAFIDLQATEFRHGSA